MLKFIHKVSVLVLLIGAIKMKAQTITTIAGTSSVGYGGDGGLAVNATFDYPSKVMIGPNGNIYIADENNYRIRMINSGGTITTIAGIGTYTYSGDGGLAVNAGLKFASDMVFDVAGNLLFCDQNNHRIRKISPSGVITTAYGTGSNISSGDGGLAINAGIKEPTSLAIDQYGDIYVAELSGCRVRKISISTGIITTVAGTGACGFNGNNIPATSALISYPSVIRFDAAGNLYLYESQIYRIRKINTSGIISTVVGSGNMGYGGDGGAATSATLNGYGGLAFGLQNELYFSDDGNHRIRVVNSGIVNTYVGIGIGGFYGDGGNPLFARINQRGIATSSLGQLFIADILNNRIRLVQPCYAPPSPSVVSGITSLRACYNNTTTISAAGSGTLSWFTSATGGSAIANGSNFTTPTITNTTTYYVQANTCTNSVSRTALTVSVLALPSISVAPSNSVICLGNTVSLAGTGAVSYTWSNGIINNVPFTPSITGNYSISGTDLNGCVNVNSITVLVLQQPTIGINASNTLICQGSTVQLSGTGGIVYSWSGGINNNSVFTPSTSGNYTVIGFNACGSSSAAVSLSVAPAPAFSITISNPSVCLGNTTSINASGANSYTWSGGFANGAVISPSASTIYTLYGNSNCGVSTATASIFVYALPTVSYTAIHTVVCNGATTALQGNGAQTYSWMGGISDGQSFAPISNSTYTVVGTDAHGCSNTAVASISVATIPTIAVNVINPIVCYGNNCTFSSSGAPTYSWTGGISDAVPFTPSASAIYTVTGTNACGSSTAVASVTVNPLPNLTASLVNPTICAGGTTAVQGQGANTYTWSNGLLNNLPFTATTSSNYTLQGTNSFGCQNSTVVSLVVNPLPNVIALVSNTIICSGNSITLSGSGATSYTWSGGITNNSTIVLNATATYSLAGIDNNGCRNTSAVTVSVVSIPQVFAQASNSIICMGNTVSLNATGALSYTWAGGFANNAILSPSITTNYVVTGINPCGSSTAAITISVDPIPTINVNSSNSVVCQGNTVSLNASGANTYTWSNGVINNVAFMPINSTTYVVIGRSASGCTNSAIKSITVNSLPTVSITQNNFSYCYNPTGTNTLVLIGTGADSYTWSGGTITNGLPFNWNTVGVSNFSLVGSNTLTGCTSTNAAIANVTVFPVPSLTTLVSSNPVCLSNTVLVNAFGANTYTWTGGVSSGVPFTPTSNVSYTVQGTNTITGCTSTPVIVNVNTAPTPVLTVAVSASSVCAGSAASFTASGANSYVWTNGIVNGNTFTPSGSGVYTVVGTNSLGCTAIAIRSINIYALPTLSIIPSNSLVCAGGTLAINVTGASTYSINHGNVNNGPFTPTVSNYTITGINASSGCSINVARVIPITPLPTLNVVASSTSICTGNTISLTGSGIHVLQWNNNVVNGQAFMPITSNTYILNVTNTLTGCTSSTAIPIQVNALPSLTILASNTLICKGDSISFTASGANTYTWSSGISNALYFKPTASNTYTVNGKITQSGCINSKTISIIVNPKPVINISTTSSVICLGDTTRIMASSGTNTLTVLNPITLNTVFTPSTSNYYTVTATSSLGCSDSGTILIQVNALPNISLTPSSTLICEGQSMTLTPSGGISYTLNSNLIYYPVVEYPTSNTAYTLVGVDANGCVNITVYNFTLSNCAGLNAYELNPEITVYPIPTSNNIIIKSNQWCHLNLVNELGQILKIIECKNQLTILSLSELSNGIYYLIEISGSKQIRKKVIVAKD